MSCAAIWGPRQPCYAGIWAPASEFSTAPHIGWPANGALPELARAQVGRRRAVHRGVNELFIARTGDARTLQQLLVSGTETELSYMSADDAADARRRELRLLAECEHGDVAEAADFEACCVSPTFVSTYQGAE